MKITIDNKQYEAVEFNPKEEADNLLVIEDKYYNITPTNPLQEELEREFEEWAERFTGAYGQGHVVEARFCELEKYPELKEKVSSLITKALTKKV